MMSSLPLTESLTEAMTEAPLLSNAVSREFVQLSRRERSDQLGHSITTTRVRRLSAMTGYR